eukprot:Gb_31689 [translate_table: standard]
MKTMLHCLGHIVPRYGRIPFVWLRCGRFLSSNHYLEWLKEWNDGSFIFKQAGLHFPSRSLTRQGRWRAKGFCIAVAWGVGLCVNRFWKRVCHFLNMGGDLVTTESTVLKIDEDIRSILEEASMLSFFKKYSRHNDSITNQFVESWKDGRVSVNGLEFFISEVLISEVLRQRNEGETISRDKTNQVGQLTKFIRDDETFCWLDSRIARESLPKPWDKVAVQVMKYLTLEGKFRKLFGYHIAILNAIRNKEKVNIPLFLLKSMEKSVKAVKAGKGKAPLHQGLMKMLADFELHRKSTTAGPTKGVFVRVSGALVSKAQLLLGPTPSSPLVISSDTASDSNGDSRNLGGDCPTTNPKEKGGRKRKPPAQVLSANIAKCSKRSSSLQRKTAEKAKSVDDAESSNEKRKSDDPGSLGGRSNALKVTVVSPLKKGAKSSEGSHLLSEELRCHLRVLNSLGGSLTSTCACINLLTLEITKCLKEVVKNIKDLNANKEQ